MGTQVKFDYSLTNGIVSEDEIKSMAKIAKDAKDVLVSKSGAGNDFLGWIDLPVDYDKEEFARIQKEAEKIKSDSEVLLVIGIGGSYLGARAAIEFLRHGKRKSDSRQQEISDISRSLKVMARELNVPVIALSQLSRAVESRPDKRPMLSDLRESGAIEQDADIVMFIYRDEYYNPDSEKKGVAEVIVAKQRSGPTGPVELAWLSQYTKFGNLEYKR